MFSVSAFIGFCVLVFRYVQAAADARLYWHPAPIQALLATARDHADEYVEIGEKGAA
jgi:hypothetical protein